MRAVVHHHGSISIIDLVGELTSGNGTRVLRQQVLQLLEGGCWEIVVSLRKMTRIDRAGMDELQECRKAAAERGVDFQVVNLREAHSGRSDLEHGLGDDRHLGGGRQGIWVF